MLQSGSKILYHHVDYGRDNCHWLHKKRKLWYTHHNPPPRFLCLELLCLSAWQLHLHQLSLVFSPFIGGRFLSQAFAPPQLGASTTALFPSLHALERSSPVVFIKSTRDFLLYNLYVHSLCSELHLGTLLLLAPVVSLQYLVGFYGYSCTIYMPSCNFCFPDSPYSLLMFDSSSSCHNIHPSQNRVSIFIPFVKTLEIYNLNM
jgi:hypothetical protein